MWALSLKFPPEQNPLIKKMSVLVPVPMPVPVKLDAGAGAGL